ncbi:MAG: PAS domain S-box protein [Sphingomonas phyllosphaerae]|uniref:hybrid sensor histidine kinase/response regulator n=1 Tax=Sphingomonas phyllosphaerae TaxID=257003 RepID=UPI002FF5FA4B
MTPFLPSEDSARQPFERGGEIGKLLRGTDWSGTSLGPIDRWPIPLRAALELLLPAGAQILLFWGPERRVFYNDAYAALLHERHPAALGQPADRRWHRAWDEVAPMVDQVFATAQTLTIGNRRFDILSEGRPVTLHFDMSLSAVMLDDDTVGGVLGVVSDVTERTRTVETATRERARLRQMFDQAPGFMAVLRGPEYMIELANATYQRMTGGRTLIGRRYADALPEVAAAGFLKRLDDVRRTGEPFRAVDMPVRLPTAAPGVLRDFWIDFICQPITDEHGEVTAIFIEGIDRTDRHRAREALARGRASLEQATEAGEIATWDYDFRHDRFSCSPLGMSLYGLPPDSRPMSRAAFRSLVEPDDLPILQEAFPRVVDPAIRAAFDVEYRVAQKRIGGVRWVSVRGRGIFDGEVCVRVVGTIIDITARKLQAEAWRESEARFRTLADSLPALVWMTDPHGHVTFANRGFEAILGVAPETVGEHGWTDLLHPDRRAAALTARAGWFAAPRALSGEHPLLRRDGATRWMHIEARPRFLGAAFQGYTACAIDVTDAHLAGERLEARVAERTAELTEQIAERERVEETLHQMQRLEAIGQLTSGVAHDFNNLLTVILGNVDSLVAAGKRGLLDPRLEPRLDHVRIAAERGAALTAQLLAFSRRQRLEAKVVDLNQTVTRLLDLLGSTLGREITIETHTPSGIWPAFVDPTQMELIILNLAINARDAMPDGGALMLSVDNATLGSPERAEDPPPGDYVRVAVTDTGVGMTDAVLARAFEPFFTTKEVGKGSGLGLAQVFGFAKQSGGGVRIDSTPGRGTTVSVFVPRAAGPAASVSDAPTPAPAESLDGATVMVLDDDDRVRQVAVEALREVGCRVVEAADGESALEALLHEPAIRLVVTDIAMPGMTGIQFARRVQELHRGVEVLFVTGHADPTDMAGVRQDRLIRKPYPRRLLLERVRAILAEA